MVRSSVRRGIAGLVVLLLAPAAAAQQVAQPPECAGLSDR